MCVRQGARWHQEPGLFSVKSQSSSSRQAHAGLLMHMMTCWHRAGDARLPPSRRGDLPHTRWARSCSPFHLCIAIVILNLHNAGRSHVRGARKMKALAPKRIVPFLISAALFWSAACDSSGRTSPGDGSPTSNGGAGGMSSGGASGSPGQGGNGSGGTPAAGGASTSGLDGSAGATGAGGLANGGGGGGIDRGVGGGGENGTGGAVDGGCVGSACSVDAGSGDVSLLNCAQLTTAAACDARGDCHSVYVDPGTCGCGTAGCCARFNHCVDGGVTDCSGPASCTVAQPFCESPYVLSYAGGCFEGCVFPAECAPPVCPAAPPMSGSSCGSIDFSCLYEACSTTGRTLAKCSGGTWAVESGPCTAVNCPGAGTYGGLPLTCGAGQVCVRTTGGGGAYLVTPSCIDNTCGQRAVSTDCLQEPTPSCSASYSLSGVTVECQDQTSACGPDGRPCA